MKNNGARPPAQGWGTVLSLGIICGMAGSVTLPGYLSGKGISGSYAVIAWTVYGFLLMWGIYVGTLKILGRGRDSKSKLLIDFLWLILAIWTAGRASEFYFSLFRFLRRLDSFTVYVEIFLSVILLLSVCILVLFAKWTIRYRKGSAGSLLFGAASVFIFVQWFCSYNLPLALRKFPLSEIATNMAGLTMLVLAILLANRIVGEGRSSRLEKIWRWIQAGLRPGVMKTLLVVLLPGVALNLQAVADSYSPETVSASRVDTLPVADSNFRPNIVILLADALRADHLGVYGYDQNTSPFIDRIAAEGLVFDRHHSETSWTKPSVASLFTGIHQSEHGVKTSEDLLENKLLTLAEELQRIGYNNGAFVSNPYLSRPNGFVQGFDEYNTELMDTGHWSIALLSGTPGVGWIWKYVRLVQTKFIKARAEDYNRIFTNWLDTAREPFFAYIHYMEPHAPYDPPEPYKQGEESVSRLFLSGLDGLAGIDSKLYDSEIRYWDRKVEELFNSLEGRGLLERTIFVLTSDHGEEFYEHGGFNHHRTLYEEVVHIPLILYGRGLLPASGRVERTTHANDLGNTLLRLAGMDSSQISLPGKDLMAADEGEVAKHVFMELYNTGRTTWATIRDRCKYIIDNEHDGPTQSEYFDLRLDPGEQNPILDGAEKDEVLAGVLKAHIKAAETRNATSSKVRLDKYLEQLRNLGYVK